MRQLIISLTIALLSSCATVDYQYPPKVESRLLSQVMGDGSASPDVDVLALNDRIRALIDAHIDRGWNDHRKLNELRELLFSEDRLNIGYATGSTRTAIETFKAKAGNCLSLTSLFIATARYLGLDAHYETITVRPTWNHQSGTMIRYEHIVATGRLQRGENYVVDFLPEFVIGDRRSNRVSDRTGLALYYNNLGAEHLLDGKTAQAIDYLRKAVTLRSPFSDAWNNMGAAMKRAGKVELAEFSYRRALSQDPNNYSALSNLAAFYRAIGEAEKAERFMERVNRYRRQNPWFHYFVAELFFRDGDYEDAKLLLERSIELKEDEPEFYVALAQTYDRLGNREKGRELMQIAEKYRSGELQAPERSMYHRFWTYTMNAN